MNTEHGTVSVNTENYFSDYPQMAVFRPDIFCGELVSTASDAIAKLKRLIDLGEVDGPRRGDLPDRCDL
jgi:HSP90 family molecular chaperone